MKRLDDEIVSSFTQHFSDADRAALKNFDCSLLEFDDLKKASALSANGFFKSKLDGNADPNNPIVKLFICTEWADAWLSNFIGYWNRSGPRLMDPSLEIGPAPVLIVATPRGSEQLAAIVELGLEPVNGILPYPLRFFPPSDTQMAHMQPYISNLCVSSEFRRQGLGRFLCALCEAISTSVWNKSEVYLHVEESNAAARELYNSMDYEIIEVLTEKEKTSNGMNGLLYYRKWLQRHTTNN